MESPLHKYRENCPSQVQEVVPKGNCKSTEGAQKLRTSSVIPQLDTNEERVVEQAETPSLVTSSASAPHLLPPPPEPSISTVRRESFSNVSDFDFPSNLTHLR